MDPATVALIGAAIAIAGAIAWGWARPAHAAWAGAAGALGAAVGIAAAWALAPGQLASAPWIGLTGSRLVISLDPMGAMLAVYAAALAGIVLLFAAAYLPGHLKHRGKPLREQARFATLMLGFMLSMALLLVAHDLVAMFLALELTALMSYLLIRFDHEEAEAQRAADLALLVTVGSSLLYLAGALAIAAETGTTILSELRPQAVRLPPVAIGLLALGVIAKSAQFPLHFWLPRAMVAPTPVSAYLHSAALVAAGVFVLLRLSPLLEPAGQVRAALQVVGALSIGAGALMALTSDGLKRILAGSTIAQYGYATMLVGIGSEKAIGAGVFLLVAHGVCKAALFMTAGAITQMTGAEKLSEARGVLRQTPALATASGIAALGLAGAPLTVGYFKDELFFAAAVEHGPLAAAVAGAAAAVTVVYTGRFWLGLMMGPRRERPQRRPLLVAPVVALAAMVVLGGLWLAPLRDLFTEAATAAAARHAPVDLKYKFEAKPEVLMAPGVWAAGLVLLGLRPLWQAPLDRVAGVLGRIGPQAIAGGAGRCVERASDGLHALELRDLRDRLKGVIIPTAGMVALGLIAQAAAPRALAPVGAADVPLVCALGLAGLGAVLAAGAQSHIGLVILLSFAGFGLALAFALSGAPNVALAIALVETALTVLFLAFLWRVDARDPRARAIRTPARLRFPWVGVIAGAIGGFVALVTLRTPAKSPVAASVVELSESAHARDVVTAVLADFRGFDTAGEVTVLAVAFMGAVALAWGRTRD